MLSYLSLKSVDEFVLMTEQGYGREEILKGERIILQVRPVSPSISKDRSLTLGGAESRIQHLSLLLSL